MSFASMRRSTKRWPNLSPSFCDIDERSFIGGGGSREATAYEVAEYLARSPHWAHLMRLTLKLGWYDVHRALGKL